MDEILPLIIQARSFDADVRDRHRAFGELVVRFQDMAYGVAYSVLGDVHLAQDAAQEAFLAAYRELGKLREPKAFVGWLRRIVLTQCNRMTRRKRVATIDLEAAYSLASGEPDPAALAGEREMKDQVLAAIRDLPEHERIVTMLFYISGYSQKEIADFLDLPLTTVKKRLQYARRRLKEEIFDMAIQKSLRAERPSKDERFAKRVRLFQALEADDTAGVAALLQEDATLVHEPIHREVMWSDKAMAGALPLHLAADYGHKEIVAALIFLGRM